MFKKSVLLLIAIFATASFANAVDFPEGGSPFFYKQSTAYSSIKFNEILEAYNLNLDITSDAASVLPVTYAKQSEEQAVFNNVSRAYIPSEYHDIFTSYGLMLNKQAVEDKLKVGSYAKVVNDEIVFGKTTIAYDGKDLENILAAYSLPMKKEPMVGKAPEPKPMAEPMVGDEDGDGVKDNVDACPGTPKGAKVDDRGCWALPNDVLFDFDKSVLKEGYAENLKTVKNVFDDNPSLKVLVEGHTDSKGREAYNQKLSERRAKAVYDYLVEELSISTQRLETVGYGESRPAYTNDTEIGRALNRRVELTPVR